MPLDDSLPDAVVIGQQGDKGYLDSRAQSDYGAVFGQAVIEVTENLSLTAGLRWQTETKKDSKFSTYDITLNPALIGSGYADINLITAVLASPARDGYSRHQSRGSPWTETGDYKQRDNQMLHAPSQLDSTSQ